MGHLELLRIIMVISGMSDVLKNYDRFPKIEKTKVEIVAEIDKAACELDKLIRELNIKSERIDEK